MKKIICLQGIGDIDPAILILLKKDLKWFFQKFGYKIVNLPDALPLLKSEYDYILCQFSKGYILLWNLYSIHTYNHYKLYVGNIYAANENRI